MNNTRLSLKTLIYLRANLQHENFLLVVRSNRILCLVLCQRYYHWLTLCVPTDLVITQILAHIMIHCFS